MTMPAQLAAVAATGIERGRLRGQEVGATANLTSLREAAPYRGDAGATADRLSCLLSAVTHKLLHL